MPHPGRTYVAAEDFCELAGSQQSLQTHRRQLNGDLNSHTPATTTLTPDKTNDKKDHCHKVSSKEPLVAVWRPLELWCPICQENVTTKTIFKSGLCTWLACTTTFFLGGCFGCCLIPFCLDSCKDVFHRCPNCNFTVESFKRTR